MNRNSGRTHAGLLRRAGADDARHSTRRAFLLGAIAWPALAWTSAVLAQSKRGPILIGLLNGGSREPNAGLLAAFKEALAALGRKDDALALWREALNNGYRMGADTGLGKIWAPHKDYPPFQELMKLKDGNSGRPAEPSQSP